MSHIQTDALRFPATAHHCPRTTIPPKVTNPNTSPVLAPTIPRSLAELGLVVEEGEDVLLEPAPEAELEGEMTPEAGVSS